MPNALTAGAFARLRLRYGAEPEPGEVPALVEHDFPAGRMADQYLATPAPALLAQPEAAALGALGAVLFLQGKADAPWRVVLCGEAENARAEFALPQSEWDALLAANSLVLPGEPGFAPPPKSDC